MTTLITRFEIPSGRPFPEKERGPMGPSAELGPFTPVPVRAEDVIGRVIDAVLPYAGTYGMGGPGFFAFRLGEEWLVVSIWGAGEWLQADGRRVQDFFYKEDGSPRPWMTESADEFSPRVVGRAIAAMTVGKADMTIALDDGFSISIDPDPATRPILHGSKEPRAFKASDDLRAAVFLSPTAELWVL